MNDPMLTPSRWSAALALALLPFATACLENEEEITVRPDGTVQLVVTARGQVRDLAEGYPVPLAAPWRLESEDARTWVDQLGPLTSGAELERLLEELEPFGPVEQDSEPEPKLSVSRDFARVEDLPRWYAPATDPYRTAYLERSASLEILERGERTVYVFERVFHRRQNEGRDAILMIAEELPTEFLDKLESGAPPSTEEWEAVAEIVGQTYARVGEIFVRDAVQGLYTRGSAALPPAHLDAALAVFHERMNEIFSGPNLQSWFADADEAGKELERTLRDGLRTLLERTLQQAGIAEDERNAVLYALEHDFTASDHNLDLGDEDFRVALTLPGTLVSGNYQRREGSTAQWSFEGGDLRDREIVLRAVSVLE